MLNFYPSLRSYMGDWEYYITQMTMGDIIREVKFASEFGAQENQVDFLGEARQREIAKNRVRQDIMKFLQQPHRFFSSIVVATIGGKPQFYPVSVAEDTVGNVMVGTPFERTFGVLRMEGKVQMYALDGQHRLSAIKCMLDESYRRKMRVKEDFEVPEGFEDEHISVIMIIRKKDEDPDQFLQQYRRLFSNLNRYARKTSVTTDIIMDEDDAYAILTRRLISEHSFFKGLKEAKHTRVKIKKGKNLSAKDPEFIPIETLYDTTQILLNTRERLSEGLFDKKIRPDDEVLDALYEELSNYWDAILEVLPELHKEPLKMRSNSGMGHMFFRPIGQPVLANVVRYLLDSAPSKFPDGKGTVSKMKAHLSPLSNIDWNVHHRPWDGIVSVRAGKGYIMRNESREQAMKFATLMARRMLGDVTCGLDALHEEWMYFIGIEEEEEAEKKWKKDVLPILQKK